MSAFIASIVFWLNPSFTIKGKTISLPPKPCAGLLKKELTKGRYIYYLTIPYPLCLHKDNIFYQNKPNLFLVF
jgi:hypothetical protein